MQVSNWLTAQELTQIFKIKLPTVRLWTRLGMPHLKVGRLVRFDAMLMQSWLEQKQQERTNSDKHAA